MGRETEAAASFVSYLRSTLEAEVSQDYQQLQVQVHPLYCTLSFCSRYTVHNPSDHAILYSILLIPCNCFSPRLQAGSLMYAIHSAKEFYQLLLLP